MNLGDYAEDAVVDFTFSTRTTDNTGMATLSGTPAISVYKANGTTQSTAGVTLTVDFDTVTGLNHVRIDTSADAFYATGSDYSVVITTGTVDGVSVVGETVATFSIENRTAFPKADYPTNFSSLGINGSGHVSRVTLNDTTTTNTDMRGTDNAATSATQTLLDYDGAIWVDPDGGTDGSTNGTHGKRSNPCKTWANVDSLLTARTLKKVMVVGSGTLTLTSVPSGKTGIDLDSGCSLAFSISGVTVPASAILTVTGGYQVTMTNLNVSNSGSTLILQDVQRVTGSPSGGAGVGIARLIRCRCSSSWQFLGFAEVGIHDCWHDHSASGWYTVSATTGHMTITGWDGGIELDPSGTGHIHFIGRSNDLTISGSSGTVELTGEIVYTNNGTGTLTVDPTGITMKEGVDGDTGKTLSDEIATAQTDLDTITGTDGALLDSATTDVYHADIDVRIDESNTRDEFSITWFKNGVRVTSGITVPTIQVVKRADGTDLIASTTPTEIASTGSYKHDEATNRLTAGEAALCIVGATIDGTARTFSAIVGRDSSA